MADITDKDRGILDRGTGSSRAVNMLGRERDTSQRETSTKSGNPGTFLGTETRQGTLYAKYRAERGTWVSASLAQQGYDKMYGKDVAYGAYLDVVMAPDGKPLKAPDRIQPGQEYLIPLKRVVGFEDQPITGYQWPQTRVDAKGWREQKGSRMVKDLFLKLSDLPFGTFELKGPKPPSRAPREAVAFWLAIHKKEIVKAETDWHVSRLAIAGIIAWEALINPEAGSFKTVGPGKIHLVGESGQISWPEAVEVTGRSKGLIEIERRIQLSKPEVAINYIGAILDFIAEVAEARGWNIRNNPEILGQVYHSRTAEQWIATVKTKSSNAPFTVVPGTMGKWIADNKKYLEETVGKPVSW